MNSELLSSFLANFTPGVPGLASLAKDLGRAHRQAQEELCRRDPCYFLREFGHVYDATSSAWLPFRLWPAQEATLATVQASRLVICLKARQLGKTWLLLGYALWTILFRPGSTILLFSLRDDEAVELLDRLKGMYRRLPDWLRVDKREPLGNDHEWQLTNGSRALAFPTTGGRSYTATLAIVDEADYIPDLDRLLDAVKPTVDAGGQLVLLSTVDKGQPESLFKAIYRAAKAGQNSYAPVFLPWSARPDRTPAWYEEQRRDSLANTGSLDSLHEKYPATDAEALAPRSLDKRIPAPWLTACYQEAGPCVIPPAHFPKPPAIPGLTVYAVPIKDRKYGCGSDPAEGNPTSDESSATWLDVKTGEEVASLHGRIEMSTFAAHVAAVSEWFNKASVLVERNNHGHTVLAWLGDNAKQIPRLSGDDGKLGWNTTSKSKAALYVKAADTFRDREAVIHDFGTLTQLQSIEGSTLKAPDNQHDDRATGFVLAIVAVEKLTGREGPQPAPYAREPGRRSPYGGPLPGVR